jgi:hypothetical protein
MLSNRGRPQKAPPNKCRQPSTLINSPDLKTLGITRDQRARRSPAWATADTGKILSHIDDRRHEKTLTHLGITRVNRNALTKQLADAPA